MPGVVDLVAVLVRFIQIGCACLLTGIFAFLVLVAASGRPVRPREKRPPASRVWTAACSGWPAIALGSGHGRRARRSRASVAFVVARGGVAGSLTPPDRRDPAPADPLRERTARSRRHAFWLLLAALLVLRWPERDRTDWLALGSAGADAGGRGPRRGCCLGPRRLGRGAAPDLAITVWTRSISWRPASGRGLSSRSLSFSGWARSHRASTLSAHAAAVAVSPPLFDPGAAVRHRGVGERRLRRCPASRRCSSLLLGTTYADTGSC